jgi:hypothetical protein
VIASLCGSEVGPRAGSWRVHGPADRTMPSQARHAGRDESGARTASLQVAAPAAKSPHAVCSNNPRRPERKFVRCEPERGTVAR